MNRMPGPGTKGGGGSRHKYKKEPGVDNSDDDESLDTLCDQVGMKSKSCSASDSPQVKVSSESPSPSKKPHDPQKIQSQTKEREPTICLGGELASYDEVKVSHFYIRHIYTSPYYFMKSKYPSILFVLLRKTL